MDIVESCKALIKKHMDEIIYGGDLGEDTTQGSQFQTQDATESSFAVDRDKNLSKILNQQAHLKRIMDEDNTIRATRVALTKICQEIEDFRKMCTKLNQEAIKNRQENMELQAKELEKYQMNQLRSIGEDYNRHQDILEQRKKEIQNLKKEIDQEEKGREAYLIDVEKKLDKQLQEREKAIRNGGNLPFQASLADNGRNSTGGLIDVPDSLELTSVDEYAPYGTAPHSRLPRAGTSGARGGRGRGRRRRG